MKQLAAFALLMALTGTTQAQFKSILKSVTTKDSATGKNTIDQVMGATGSSSIQSLSNSDIVDGLKEALEKGAQKSSDKLSMTDGFFANAALKILMPAEAKKVE